MKSQTKKKDVKQYAPLKVRISNFFASIEDFNTTRASTAINDYTTITSIIVAIYDSNNAEVQRIVQDRKNMGNNATFGEFNCTIPLGDYTILVIGRDSHGGNDAMTLTSLTEAAYTENYVRETFMATKSLTINATTEQEISIELTRSIAGLTIAPTDSKTTNATKIRTTYSKGSKSFNPSTGFALNDNGLSIINSAPSVNDTRTSYAFLTSNEVVMNVTLDILDADNNILNTCTINNVPLKCNRITKLTGALYTKSTAAAITIETDWETGETVDF